jgi:hypothetical protein
VPCKASALIAAISAANSHGGATISLGSRCTYHLTAANNTDPMLGATGLPVITSRITLNGFHTTIAGNNSTFRILLVTAPGNLTLQGLTAPGAVNGGVLAITASQIRGNTASGQGGGIFEATITPAGPAPGGPLTPDAQPGHRQHGRPGRWHLRRPRQPGHPQTHPDSQEHPGQLRPARQRHGLQELRTRPGPEPTDPADSRPGLRGARRLPDDEHAVAARGKLTDHWRSRQFSGFEPSGVSLGKAVTRVTEVHHPGRRRRAGRSKRAGWMSCKPYSKARLIGDCLASGRPRSMIQS